MAPEMSSTTAQSPLLVAKIQTLLRQPPEEEDDNHNSSYYTNDELTLTALILVSRISEPDQVRQVWIDHGRRFQTFCEHWWYDTQTRMRQAENGDSQKAVHSNITRSSDLVPLRWIVYSVQCLLTAMTAVQQDEKSNDNATTPSLVTVLEFFRDFFWNTLMQINTDNNEKNATWSSTMEVEMEVMECVFELEEKLLVPSPSLHLDVLGPYSIEKLKLLLHNDLMIPNEPAPKHDKEASDAQSPQALLHQTLQALLPQQEFTHDGPKKDEGTMKTRYDECLQALVVQQIKSFLLTPQPTKGTTSTTTTLLPSLWTDLVQFWWNQSSAKGDSDSTVRRRSEWSKLLLELLLEAHHCQSPQRTVDWGTFWEDKSQWECWTRLTMSSVSSTDLELRHLTWVAVADIIECTGWPALQRLRNSSIWISTMLRLATGEVKIQLGEIVSTTQSTSQDIEALVQILCQIILHYKGLIQVLIESQENDDDEDEMNSMVSPEFLGSLHRSLEEALDTSTQYLNVSTRRFLPIDTSVIAVLGNLLTEFDVFLSKKTGVYESSEAGDERNTMSAVVEAIKICPTECRRDLLLGLTSVLASAEGDPTRLSLLEKYKVVGETLFNLLASCWTEKQSHDISLLPVACDTVEVLADVFPSTSFTSVRCAILEWMKHECTLKDADLDALRVSLDCVMKIIDNSPTESEKTILGLASIRLL